VTVEYGKDFDFPKQHTVAHIIDDLREKLKGTTNHQTTRLGEGFHQEVKEAYAQTNGKDEDPELARIDENREAAALIHMRINDSDQAKQKATDKASAEEEPSEDTDSDQHWWCGSSGKW
ncbi:hypothetical protein B0H14DRAFT_2219703, partial [Mycena olivaceomarginata]